MNQGKMEVVKQEKVRMNIDILEISETMSHALWGHPRQMGQGGEF